MQQRNPESREIETRHLINISLSLLAIITLLAGCINSREVKDGIVFIASRGSRPPAQNIVWSPTDENKVLIAAYETPLQPAEVYILDIQTGQKEFLAGPLEPARFPEIEWMPDGKHALILSGTNTKGFEPPGWWSVNIDDKTLQFILDPVDAAWSPDGTTIAALRMEKLDTNLINIVLLLIDANTKSEETIATYDKVDFSAGLSWSPDGQNLIFSLGQYDGSSNLFVLDLETRQVMKITENNRGEYPSWSPKGSVIVFKTEGHLHLISPDGKCEVEIPNLENVWSPTWLPDGKRIAFIGRDGIYVLDTDIVFGRDIYQNLCP